MRKTRADAVFDCCNAVLMCVMLLVFLYPLYFIVIASVSEPRAVATGQVTFRVVEFTLMPYKNVLKDARIWTGYRNTILYTLAGTLYNLAVMLPAAFVTSKKGLPGRSAVMWFFLITMYFGGGLIPTYLLYKGIQWTNTRWILMFAGGVSTYNLIVSRTFFQSAIPEELYEAARIDGANNIKSFFRIALPLAMPIIAVMSLYYGVAHWNDWWTAFLYVQKAAYAPLQLVLRQILIDSQTMLSTAMELGDGELISQAEKLVYMAEGMKYAVIFIASAPLLCAYPFVQKYFVKGVLIGSVKG